MGQPLPESGVSHATPHHAASHTQAPSMQTPWSPHTARLLSSGHGTLHEVPLIPATQAAQSSPVYEVLQWHWPVVASHAP